MIQEDNGTFLGDDVYQRAFFFKFGKVGVITAI